MADFRKQWNTEMALEVVAHKTVDGKIWSEAVKWLMLYGPPKVQDLLGQAAGHATNEFFPDLKPTRFTPDGLPCYDIREVAETLGLSEDEARVKISEMEREQGVRLLFEPSDTHEVQ